MTKLQWKPHGAYPAGYGFVLWLGESPKGHALYTSGGWEANVFDPDSTDLGRFPTKGGAQRAVTKAAKELGLDRESEGW